MRPQTPLLTVDIIIELTGYPGIARPIVLIERRYPPLGWALPGGFVDEGERLEQAAVREAQEETGLDVTLLSLLGCYSDPARDPRGHSVSAVYIASASGTPCAQDDAKAIVVVDAATHGKSLVFDHAQILADYLHYRDTGQCPPLRTSSL